MKRLLLLALIFAFSSCSTYVQILTFESDNVKIQPNNKFSYSDDIVSIEYKINSEGSLFDFNIENNTDTDVIVDISKSYFIYNGQVFDYAGRSISTTLSISGSTGSSYSFGLDNRYTTSTSSTVGVSITETQDIGNQLNIPTGCYRSFSGFVIDRVIYYNYQMIYSVNDIDSYELKLSKENSPILIKNIIALIYNGEKHSITNEFYVSKIGNYPKYHAPRSSSYNNEISILKNQMYTIYTANSTKWCGDNYFYIDE